MVAYNFQPQFVPLIESGKKMQTIRAIGKKRHAEPGERIQLYTGMRHLDCRKIIDDPLCKFVWPIKIERVDGQAQVFTRGAIRHDPKAIATLDGFPDMESFIKFFEDTHGLPFEGVLIKW